MTKTFERRGDAPISDDAGTAAGHGKPSGSGGWALAGLSLAMLMPSLATSSANVALPSLAQAFDASFQAVQWIVLSYLLSFTALIVAVGYVGDRLGRRRLLLAGIAIFTVASLLCGLAPTLPLMVVARIAQGSGAAAMTVLAVALVGDAVPGSRRGKAMGLLGSMSAIGTMMGPSLGGLLVAWAGGPAIFLANVPLGVLALAIVHRALPAERRPVVARRAAFDWAGGLLMTVALAGYALAMTIGRGQFGPRNIALLLAALIAGAAFVAVETRARSPLVRMTSFNNGMVRAGLVATVLVSTVMMATLVVGPFYLSGAIGLGPSMVGLVLSAGPLVAGLAGVPAGHLVDRFGSRRMGLAGLAAIFAGACVLTGLPMGFGVAGYVLPIVVMTAGYGVFQAANNSMIMADARPDERGIMSGMLGLARNLGLITGASAMGGVFAFGVGVTDVLAADARAIASGMHLTFMVAALLIAAALVFAMRARRPVPGAKAIEATA